MKQRTHYWCKYILGKIEKGAVTDLDGYFEIDTPNGHEHLVVSYTGYSTQSLQ